MNVRLLRLRERGWPYPRYRFAFLEPITGDLIVFEQRDEILNRTTRVAKLVDPNTGAQVENIPLLRDAQLVGMTRDSLSLSGIERIEDAAIQKIEDFAQSWLCMLD